MVKRKDEIIKVQSLELNLSMPSVTLRLKRRSKDKVAGSNKPILEEIERVNNRSQTIITRDRTEKPTKVFHEGKHLKDGKWYTHEKHLKNE